MPTNYRPFIVLCCRFMGWLLSKVECTCLSITIFAVLLPFVQVISCPPPLSRTRHDNACHYPSFSLPPRSTPHPNLRRFCGYCEISEMSSRSRASVEWSRHWLVMRRSARWWRLQEGEHAARSPTEQISMPVLRLRSLWRLLWGQGARYKPLREIVRKEKREKWFLNWSKFSEAKKMFVVGWSWWLVNGEPLWTSLSSLDGLDLWWSLWA